jgi:Chromosome segregation protein Csm1/Pcs1
MLALHYKLAMEDKEVNDPHGQIVYTPHLDEKRDERILKVLPDYLTDEIMFAREQGTSLLTVLIAASLFYWRLNQYLQKKVE